MIVLERMARALCQCTYRGDNLKPIVDAGWPEYLPDAKAALAALLPLDEVATEAATNAALTDFMQGDIVDEDNIRAAITAYLNHIREGS